MSHVSGLADAIARLDQLGTAGGVGGIGFTLLESHTAAGDSAIEFTTGITSEYQMYEYRAYNVTGSVDDFGIRMTVSQDRGATYESANYQYKQFLAATSGAGTGELQSNSASAIECAHTQAANGIGNASGEGVSMMTGRFAPNMDSVFIGFLMDVRFYNVAGDLVFGYGSGSWTGGIATMNAIKFAPSTGVFDTGEFRLFGLS